MMSSNPQMRSLVTSFISLDDSTFERTVKRCCDPDRPKLLLTRIINEWGKLVIRRKDQHKSNEIIRSYTVDKDFLAAATKEEEILVDVKKLENNEYRELFPCIFDLGRPDRQLKDTINYWKGMIKDDIRKGSESPEIQIIDIDLCPTNSSIRANSRPSCTSSQKSPVIGLNHLRSKSPPSKPKRASRRISPTPPSRRRECSSDHSPKPKQSKIEKPEAELYSNQLFQERLALQAEGIWSSDLEMNWRVMEVEETRLTKEFEDTGKKLASTPEKHPKYAEEWKEFWENKASIIEDSGGDAENYDYLPEWKEYWARRMETLLRIDFNMKVDEIRRKYGMDLDTLSRIRMKRGNGKGASRVNSNLEDEEFDSIRESGRSTWRAGNSVDSLDPVWVQDRPEIIIAESKVEGLSGIDLVQVVRRLTTLETQLSFLAPNVMEFFKIAEQMEMSGRSNSNLLLVNQEFLELLYKCRYRLQALIQANVLPSDVLGALKHSVRSLEIILESSKCKQILSNPRLSEIPISRPAFYDFKSIASSMNHSLPRNVLTPPPILLVDEADHPHDTNTKTGCEQVKAAILKRVDHLSIDQRERITELLTSNLVKDGREKIGDKELLEFVMKTIDPMVKSVELHSSPPRLTSPLHFSKQSSSLSCQQSSKNQNDPMQLSLNPIHWRGNDVNQESSVSHNFNHWTGDMETGTKRTIGSAMPPLPKSEVRARALEQGQTVSHYQQGRRGMFSAPRNQIVKSANSFAKPNGYSQREELDVPRPNNWSSSDWSDLSFRRRGRNRSQLQEEEEDREITNVIRPN